MPTRVDTELVVKLTDGTVVHGKTNRKTYNRLSDALNAEEDAFLVLYDALVGDEDTKTIFINKQQIVWVQPDEDSSGPRINDLDSP